LKTPAARIESWTWPLIYGGLGLLGVGFALQQKASAWGLSVMAVGALTAGVGAVLIWVRSRMADPPNAEPAPPPASEAPP